MENIEKETILKAIEALKLEHNHTISKLEMLVSKGFCVHAYETGYSYKDAFINQLFEDIDKNPYKIDGLGNSLLKAHILKFFKDNKTT